jgi:hypothetical protein
MNIPHCFQNENVNTDKGTFTEFLTDWIMVCIRLIVEFLKFFYDTCKNKGTVKKMNFYGDITIMPVKGLIKAHAFEQGEIFIIPHPCYRNIVFCHLLWTTASFIS